MPENLSGHTSLPKFILGELVSVATDMLTFINSISEIKKEDKYSDLIILSLNNRLKNYGWHVGNARGGYSESGKPNPGEIDYAIFAMKEKIAVCEALLLKGKNVSAVQVHNSKIFNYDPARKLFYIIVYYISDGDKFLKNWEGYKTQAFGNVSVKTAKSIHGVDTPIYQP